MTGLLSFSASLLIFFATSIAALPQAASHQTQTVSLPQLTAQISVDYTAVGHRAMIIATFSTSDRRQYNVNCLSAYRDIDYVLRNSAGAVMRIDSNARKNAVVIMTDQETKMPCEHMPWTQKQSRALLGVLYPEAPHGTYVLDMTLAPRGRSDRARLAPVTVQL